MMNTKTADDLTVEQFYTDINGNVWPEETWITQDNRKILVKDLEVDHLKNIVRMIIRNDRTQLEQYTQMLEALELVFAQVEREESGRLLN